MNDETHKSQSLWTRTNILTWTRTLASADELFQFNWILQNENQYLIIISIFQAGIWISSVKHFPNNDIRRQRPQNATPTSGLSLPLAIQYDGEATIICHLSFFDSFNAVSLFDKRYRYDTITFSERTIVELLRKASPGCHRPISKIRFFSSLLLTARYVLSFRLSRCMGSIPFALSSYYGANLSCKMRSYLAKYARQQELSFCNRCTIACRVNIRLDIGRG
jgi:hypothetical protein